MILFFFVLIVILIFFFSFFIFRMGLPCACEFLDLLVPSYISDLISWGSTGARTVDSQVVHACMHLSLSLSLSLSLYVLCVYICMHTLDGCRV